MNQSWKDAWWVVYVPMQMCPVSDYRRISGITNFTFLVALHPLAAAPARCALWQRLQRELGHASSSRQALLHGCGFQLWAQILQLVCGDLGGRSVGSVLIPEGHLHWLWPRLHDEHCKLLLGSISKSIKAALVVSWHSPRQLWQWCTDADCSTWVSPMARGKGFRGLIAQHRLQQPERDDQQLGTRLSPGISAPRGEAFPGHPAQETWWVSTLCRMLPAGSCSLKPLTLAWLVSFQRRPPLCNPTRAHHQHPPAPPARDSQGALRCVANNRWGLPAPPWC